MKNVKNELFKKDLDYKRFYSHLFQIRLIMDLKPEKLLEIGIGDGFVTKQLKDICYVTTLDNDERKKPDWNLDISDLCSLDKLGDYYYDTILVCEVLEHVPYEKVEEILKILKKKVKKSKYIILSVPNQSRYLKLNISKHGFTRKKKIFKIIRFSVKIFNKIMSLACKIHYEVIKKREHYHSLADGEHHWELGVDKYSVKKFKTMLERNFNIVLDERVKEFPWHHFFILQKKEKKFKVPRDPDIDPITFVAFSKI